MKIKLFWFGDKDSRLWPYRWGMRGVAFTHGNCTRNVHYRDLLFLFGFGWRIKMRIGIRAWRSLLTFGYLH